MNERKFFIKTLILSGAAILLIAGFSYSVNLFKFKSDRPLAGIPARQYNGVLINTFEFDSIIAGSSMSQCFKCSDFDRAFGGRSLKLTMSSSNVSEIRFMLEEAEKRHKVKRIMFDLSPAFLRREQTLDKIEMEYYTQRPEQFLIKKSFSFDFLGESIDFLSRLCRKKVKYTTLDDIYRWDKSRPCAKKYLARNLIYKKNQHRDCAAPQAVAEAKKNIENYLIPFLKKHSDKEIIIFFPPFSIMFYQDIDIDSYVKLKSEYIDILMQFKNVKLYDFETAFHVAGNFDNYRDRLHYSSEISSWIISSMTTGEYLVTPANKSERLRKLQQYTSSYDYRTAYQDLKQYYLEKKK